MTTALTVHDLPEPHYKIPEDVLIGLTVLGGILSDVDSNLHTSIHGGEGGKRGGGEEEGREERGRRGKGEEGRRGG